MDAKFVTHVIFNALIQETILCVFSGIAHRPIREIPYVEPVHNLDHTGLLNIRNEGITSSQNALFFYNRVPKCGSRNVQSMIQDAMKRKLINYSTTNVHCFANVSENEQVRILLLFGKYVNEGKLF